MKRLILFAILFSSLRSFAQENPWLPKGENPWLVYQGAGEAVPVKEEIVTADTLLMEAGVKTQVQSESVDTLSPAGTAENEVFQPDTSLSQKELLFVAGQEATEGYNAGGDFAFGFFTGVVFNVFSIPTLDPIYVIPTSKKEKAAIKAVVENPAYQELDKESLHKKAKSNIKGKKLGITVLGSVVGSVTQLGVFLALISL